MNNIKVLIVEDKMLIAEDIASRLRHHGMDVTEICASAEDAIQSAMTHKPDLILMDIQLAGKMDGITAVSVIRKSFEVPVIYLSDHTDHATLERAKKTLPENYLTKPFQEPDLIRAIDLAFYNFNNKTRQSSVKDDESVFLRVDNQAYVKIALKDILYVAAERAYCKVVCTDAEYLLSTSMNHISEQIMSDDFVRVHRSYTINVRNITSLEGNTVWLGKRQITINKEAREALGARFRFVK